MTSFLDTNILLRYLTGEPPEQAEIAAAIIDGTGDLWVTMTSVEETSYILTRSLGIPRNEVVETLVAFLDRERIIPYAIDKEYLIHGLLMCLPSEGISVADALTWAAARTANAEVVYSFDENFPAEGVQVLRTRQ